MKVDISSIRMCIVYVCGVVYYKKGKMVREGAGSKDNELSPLFWREINSLV